MSKQKRQVHNKQLASADTAAITDVPTIDIEEILYRLLGSWKLILCLALVFAVAVGVYTVCFVKPLYEATSIIYVLSDRDSAINFSDLQLGSALTSDYIKALKMWEVHEQVITNLNLPYSYKEISKMLTIKNETDTRMLDIVVSSTDPTEAAAIANEYAKVGSQYIADTMLTDKPSIVSVALVPTNPVSPNKTKNIILGFLAGGLLACGFIVVRAVMDDKYKTTEDIRKYTGLNTLAIVPIDEDNAVLSGHNTAKNAQHKGRKSI